MSRADVIAAVLRHLRPVREPLAYELRGSVVQLLGPSTTDPTWTATPEVLAEAIDSALEKDTRRRIPAAAGGSTARAEIVAVLQAVGYQAEEATNLLARAFRQPHASPCGHRLPEDPRRWPCPGPRVRRLRTGRHLPVRPCPRPHHRERHR